MRSKWDVWPLGKCRVTATPSLELVGLMPMTPLPAAIKVPRSMVAVALSGMRTVACVSLSGSSSDQRVAVPVSAYSPYEQPTLPAFPHGGLLSITRQMVEGAAYRRYTSAPGQLPTRRVSGSISSGNGGQRRGAVAPGESGVASGSRGSGHGCYPLFVGGYLLGMAPMESTTAV